RSGRRLCDREGWLGHRTGGRCRRSRGGAGRSLNQSRISGRLRRVIHLLDTGPLVALLNSRDHHHAWARVILGAVPAPIHTCEAVVAEACHILRVIPGGADAVMRLVEAGILRPSLSLASEAAAVRRLMAKYADVPMSLA